MEVVVGGMLLEVSCGASNAITLGLLYLGPAGWLSAASIVLSNAYNGCSKSTV
jgi:hypothetical protein